MEMNEYLDVFIDESKEHLQAINDHLLVFENEPTNIEIVNEIFRSAHTLKGMAATMGYEDLADLTHQMENALDVIRNGSLTVTDEMIDVMFSSVDVLEEMVFSIADQGSTATDISSVVQQLSRIVHEDHHSTERDDHIEADHQHTERQTTGIDHLNMDQFEQTVLTQSLESDHLVYHMQVTLTADCVLKAARAYMLFTLLEQSGEIIKSVPTVEEIEKERFDSSFELIYVSTEDHQYLNDMILQVSEVEGVTIHQLQASHFEGSDKKSSSSTAQKSSAPLQQESSKNSNKTIRVNIDRLDALMNRFSEWMIDQGRLEQLSRELNHQDLQETVEHMSRISSELQDVILNMRMVPIEQVFKRFPRMIRGLAKDLNKKVNLHMSGVETELDRTVIDEIGDPLVHLLRNAIDHGLETAQERRKKGKEEHGTIELQAFHSGNHVLIEIRDDGQGIDAKKVLEKAVNHNLLTAEQAETMSDQEIYQLLFDSGFSTADQVSDVSGRGVGLDVVRDKIESLSGTVFVHSKQGEGTTFTIQLPLTLSIISALLVEVGTEKYAIPLTSIIETAVYKKEDIRSVHGQQIIDFRGSVVPLVSLAKVFEVPMKQTLKDVVTVVIVQKGDKMAGLIVDALIGQHEIVLKSIGQYLANIPAISGATILGDGQVALIIDCNAFIK